MKNKSLSKIKIKLIHVVIIALVLCPTVSRGQERGIDGLHISMDLVNQKDKTSRSLPKGSIELTLKKIIFKDNNRIENLLTENGISPDGESIGIIYKLNPGFDFKSIKAGSEITLPIIKDKQPLSGEFSRGSLVALRLDKKLKQDFIRVLSKLKTSAAETSGLKLQQFESRETKDKFVETTKSIIEKMGAFKAAIIYRTRPLSSKMIQQMRDEAKQVQLVLIKIIRGNQKVSKADFETVDLVEKNMNIRMKALVEEKGDEELPAPVKTIEHALWNAWFEDAYNDRYVEELEPTNEYYFTLDISRFSYFKEEETVIDLSVQNQIQKALDDGKTKIKLVIRPILVGDVVRFVEDQGQSRVLDKELVIDINELVKPKDASAETEKKSMQELMHKAYEKKKLTLLQVHQFAEKVRAGEVKFKIKAVKPGYAVLSFSIWDQSGMIPLDHLVQVVKVLDPMTLKEKSPAVKTSSIKAGLGTLLNVSLDFATEGTLDVDAAFYIFEPAPEATPEGNSMVLFAIRQAKTDPGAPDKKQDISIYAWKTKSLLSGYVGNENELFAAVEKARTDSSYESVAEELKNKFFTEFDDKKDGAAATALKSLQDLVSQKENAIVFVRMRNEKGASVYPPLGILAASGKTRILKNKIILVQPLPREYYPAGKSPVETWTLGIPGALAGLTTPLIVAALRPFKESEKEKGWISWETENGKKRKMNVSEDPRIRRDITALKGFFETSPSNSKPEGILVLAHHGGGYLWFTESAKRIIVENIKHDFAHGSIAILSACSIAAAQNNNQTILRDLNEHNIDAMIISPFPVDPDYGTMLAINFIQMLENAKIDKKKPTVAQLFVDAAKKTAAYFKKEMNLEFNEVDLEFLIAGDYRIIAAPK